MKLNKYIPQGQYFQNLADIKQIGVARALLDGIEIKRNEIRELNENKPMICNEDIAKDFRFRAGAIWALNWVLSLPSEAEKYINKLPDEKF